jgi:protein with PEP-CTERM/exosortase system signal
MVKHQNTKTPMKAKSLLIASLVEVSPRLAPLAIAVAAMKTSPTILEKRPRFFPALLGAAVSLLLIGAPAQAGYIVTLEQVGSNVVATGTGAIDLTGLTFVSGSGASVTFITPSGGAIVTGPENQDDVYRGISGPTNFGSGGLTLANSSNGDQVGMGDSSTLFVHHGYTSESPLSDSATYDSATFSSLGVTPGTYEWTWGIGADQNFTLQIGPASVPDSGSTFGLLFLALIALFGAARFRSGQLA